MSLYGLDVASFMACGYVGVDGFREVLLGFHKLSIVLVLLMEDILHHLGCINPIDNGIFTISTGAGLCPSTVCFSD